jgi:MarR family transcriptional regulator, organic hydroperoxide resistance regulator
MPTIDAGSDAALVAMRKILKATEANVKAVAMQSGLTASQLRVLQILSARGEMLTGELARAVDLKLATVSILLDKLQDTDLVTRQRGEEDRRQVFINITAQGREVLRKAPDLLQERFRARFGELPEWEQAFVVAGLLRAVSLLGAEDIDASAVLDIGGLNELPAQ